MESKLFSDRGYTPIKTLHRCSFRVRILLAKCQRSNRKVVLKFKEPNPLDDDDEKAVSDFIRNEADILANLDHINIIKFIDFFSVHQTSVLVMEFALGGTLAALIRTNRKLQNEQAKKLTNQLLDALIYLHRHNIAHCDIKSDNILLDEDKNVKLSDFGFSEDVNNPSGEDIWKGSIAFASPEVIRGWSCKRTKGDVWSLGVVVFHMVTGYLPFGSTLGASDILGRMTEPLRWPRPLTSVNPGCREFVGMALEQDGCKRPTMEQIKYHMWLL